MADHLSGWFLEFYEVGNWSRPKLCISREYATHQFAPIATSPKGVLVALAVSRYTIQLFRMPAASAPGHPSSSAPWPTPTAVRLKCWLSASMAAGWLR